MVLLKLNLSLFEFEIKKMKTRLSSRYIFFILFQKTPELTLLFTGKFYLLLRILSECFPAASPGSLCNQDLLKQLFLSLHPGLRS